MAWKLKKSKVEEDIDTPENVSKVIVTHGHDTGGSQTLASDPDDFFASRVDDADEAIHSLNNARQTPFNDDIFMAEHPLPKASDIPVIKSAFVSAEPEEAVSPNGVVDFDEQEIAAERTPIDFEDVEFDADREPETLEFGTAPIAHEPELIAPEVIQSAPVATQPVVEDLDTTVSIAAPIVEEPKIAAPAQTTYEPEIFSPEQDVIAPAPVAPEPIAAQAPVAPAPVPEAPKTPKLPMPTKVVVTLGPFAAEQDLTAVGTEMVIGRRDYNVEDSPAISIDLDDAISRKHARILVLDGQCKIEDTGSTNGTKINGQPLMAHVPMPFNIGDVVRVGERTEITLK